MNSSMSLRIRDSGMGGSWCHIVISKNYSYLVNKRDANQL